MISYLQPNGRFEVNKKICLSISGHHPESWQPSWSIRTALLALIAFMPTPAAGTIGSLDYTSEERRILAKKSLNWECDICGKISNKLTTTKVSVPQPLTSEETSLIQQISLKAEEDTNRKHSIENIPEDNNIECNRTEETSLRQRILEDTVQAEEQIVTDVLLEASIQRSNKYIIIFIC